MEADSSESTENVDKKRQRRRKDKSRPSKNCRVDLGRESCRWNELKTALQLTDEDLVTLLIDRFVDCEVTPSQSNGHAVKSRYNEKHGRKINLQCNKTSDFNLSEYGVYFPQREDDDVVAETVSTIEDVYNINYGHNAESQKQAQSKQMISPVPIHVTDPCAASRENAYLVYNSCLIQLANQNPPSQCSVKNCKADVSMVKKHFGTSIYFIWTCSKGHTIREWSSQPSLQGQGHLGDLMLASGIQMSGCNYQQVALMMKIINVECISAESFSYFKDSFVVPKIMWYWLQEQDEILSVLEGREVVLLGGGNKSESGSSSTKYGTYHILDYETSEVLYISVTGKTEADGYVDDTKLEFQAFCKALHIIQSAGAIVVEIVTNIEPKINAYLRKKLPDIKRSYDMWEGAKLIGKEIVEASYETECSDLLSWLPYITNHFLESSKTCAELSGSLWSSTDEEAFKDSFSTGLIHHTMNSHQWISGACTHVHLSEDDKSWLVADSPAHNKLKHVLLSKTISSTLGNFSTNRTTCGLENLMKYIAVYTPDNHTYSLMEYKSRVYLAVLDYINHQYLRSRVDEKGSEILCRVFSHYSGQYEIQPRKEAKSYHYLPVIIEKIVGAALNST